MKNDCLNSLPPRLTVSFPLWLFYGTKGENSPYYNIEKVIREHKERGFNCIRIDSGAGLIHDLEGNLREPFDIGDMFGEYEKIPRQQHVIGDGGKCDLLERLIETFEVCKRYGIYVILSQWYYLHTYWYHKAGDPVCDEMFAIEPRDRFDAFRKFWHYILSELERRGLDSQIAFVEVFNEAYRLREKNAVLNWFDITEVEGYLSINDKMSDIMAAPEGMQLFGAMFAQMMPKKGDTVAGGFEMNDAMMSMLGGFTFIRLAGMMGMMGVNLTKEQLLGINAQLNKIKKP